MTLPELATMIREKSAAMAVIVFTTAEKVQQLMTALPNAKELTVETDAGFLRSLDERASADGHWVLLTEDPECLRGFDYRGHHKGLCLVCDRGFQSDREAR